MDLVVLRNWLIAEEGIRRVAYQDMRGVLTIGVGHNLARPLSSRAIDLILDDDLADTIGAVQLRFPWLNAHSDVRQAVIVDLAFNVGVEGVAQFTEMLAALKIGDFEGAADQMLASRWAAQVGSRATTLAARMRTGIE